ncbi:MAG: Bax inhibitor-1 family protein [Armatimonadetes bacterium]|nr:Bax inhibitor-1 family protein [Armatimonadota bacterium]MDE2205530.1 Bax inhibitor-1 family protein [Armatimonadota bacterium]
MQTAAVGYRVIDAPVDVRAAFVRKVFGIFFSSVLVSVAAGAYVAGQANLAIAVLNNFMVLLFVGLGVGIGMVFLSRVQGVNYAFLYLYSAIQGAILGPVLVLVGAHAPGVPLQAAVLTTVVFGGLAGYALVSRTDFNFLGGILTVGLLGLLVVMVVLFFFRLPFLSSLYTYAGVLIFSGFVLYDTSRIQHRLGPDDAVAGAVSLYLDALNLFWFILRLLSNRRN